ncbi:uncharacterized protein BcabD6B2_37130 [Babesia caballi]|uniref:Secreted protein n=1 Tax=Babesia caballi TaxID=5871 RepID=A0AAV4LWZ4_BABCB|nr:hypothetical protein BcabD6B2_37130 [Babesia caballi]
MCSRDSMSSCPGRNTSTSPCLYVRLIWSTLTIAACTTVGSTLQAATYLQIVLLRVGRVVGVKGERSARDPYHRAPLEERREGRRLERGGHDDHLQIPPLRDARSQDPQQHICTDRPFVRLVNDHDGVLGEEAVIEHLAQQHAVRDVFDFRLF